MVQSQNKKKSYKLGVLAEMVATLTLVLKGYTIKERRFRSHYGEIDIIAQKGNTIIFCEVKARKDYITAIESLSEHQKKRINNSAEHYLSNLNSVSRNNKIENKTFRCDMILIIPWRWPVHIKNAW